MMEWLFVYKQFITSTSKFYFAKNVITPYIMSNVDDWTCHTLNIFFWFTVTFWFWRSYIASCFWSRIWRQKQVSVRVRQNTPQTAWIQGHGLTLKLLDAMLALTKSHALQCTCTLYVHPSEHYTICVPYVLWRTVSGFTNFVTHGRPSISSQL